MRSAHQAAYLSCVTIVCHGKRLGARIYRIVDPLMPRIDARTPLYDQWYDFGNVAAHVDAHAFMHADWLTS